MLRKFNFLVLDDRKKNEEGWYRIFEHVLIANDYLVPGRGKEELFDAMQPLDQMKKSASFTSMNYMVISPETNFNYRKAQDFFIKHQSEFDLFFIDIDLRQNDFLEGVKLDRPELAGFQFISLMPKGKRPIFFFSGANVGTINMMIDELNKWGERLSDVLFGKIEMAPTPEDFEDFDIFEDFDSTTGGNFISKIYERIDQYMRGIQISVCSRLELPLVNRLREIVRENRIEIFDDHIIPCPLQVGTNWSLRTLFPKQINKITLNRNKAESHRQHILEVLQTDWRMLMCHVTDDPNGAKSYHGLLRHPGNVKNIGRLLDAVEQSELIAEKDPEGWRYISITTLAEYIDYRKVISEGRTGAYSKIRDSAINRVKKETDGDTTWRLKPVDMKDLAEKYGILPTDILHIHKIAHHNSSTHKNPLLSFGFREEQGQSHIVFEWRFEKDFNVFLEAERRVLELVEKSLNRLTTAGMADVSILACVRYKGTFEWFDKFNNTISVWYAQGKFQLSRKGLLAKAQGYRIIIQSPCHA